MSKDRMRKRRSPSGRSVTIGTLFSKVLGLTLAAMVVSGVLTVGSSVALEDVAGAASDVAAGSWSSGSSMPDARSEMGAATVAGDVIIAGGVDQSGTILGSVASYDPAADEWTRRASMPAPRGHAAVAGWGGRLYSSGGGDLVRGLIHANLWVYDPVADAWASLATMPAGRWQHAMVALDGVLYVVGGLIEGRDDHSAVWAYDIAADAWRTDLAPLPTPRDHLSAVATSGEIVVLGGRVGANLASVEIQAAEHVDGLDVAIGRVPAMELAQSHITSAEGAADRATSVRMRRPRLSRLCGTRVAVASRLGR